MVINQRRENKPTKVYWKYIELYKVEIYVEDTEFLNSIISLDLWRYLIKGL